MDLLLDTHALLWFLSGSEQLSPRARDAIENSGNTLYVSDGSLWEMAIKFSSGKLKLSPDYATFVARFVTGNPRLRMLRLSVAHCARIAVLGYPHPNHRDPFDRALIAQCLEDGLTCISCDEKFDAYGVTRLW